MCSGMDWKKCHNCECSWTTLDRQKLEFRRQQTNTRLPNQRAKKRTRPGSKGNSQGIKPGARARIWKSECKIRQEPEAGDKLKSRNKSRSQRQGEELYPGWSCLQIGNSALYSKDEMLGEFLKCKPETGGLRKNQLEPSWASWITQVIQGLNCYNKKY